MVENHISQLPCDFWRFLLMFPTEDWSESWSLEAGTLQVEMSIAICGQDGKEMSALWSQFQVEMARNHWFVGGKVIYRW